MTQWQYDLHYVPHSAVQVPPAPARLGALVNILGAVLSVALIAGVSVWGYRLMVRDVSGVPVVRAMDGPMRLSPADPGGRQAAFQGLAVNSVAAEGVAGPAPDRVVLAPAPVTLTEADMAARRPPAAVPAQAPVAPDAIPAPIQVAAVLPVPGAADVAPAAAQPLAVLPADAPGLARSPIPRPRPGGLTARTQSPATTAPAGATGRDSVAEAVLDDLVARMAAPRVTEIDPATLAPGTRLVQLGAYDTAAEARAAWDALANRFGGFFDGQARVVEAATSGGRDFFRLRAHGFRDEPEARRFCSVLLAENVDCIPVLVR